VSGKHLHSGELECLQAAQKNKTLTPISVTPVNHQTVNITILLLQLHVTCLSYTSAEHIELCYML